MLDALVVLTTRKEHPFRSISLVPSLLHATARCLAVFLVHGTAR